MYLKVQTGKLMVRISKTEAEQLYSGEILSQKIQLSTTASLSYSVQSSLAESDFQFLKNENSFELFINQLELEKQLIGSPTKQGIVFETTNDDVTLLISLEIDLKRTRKAN